MAYHETTGVYPAEPYVRGFVLVMDTGLTMFADVCATGDHELYLRDAATEWWQGQVWSVGGLPAPFQMSHDYGVQGAVHFHVVHCPEPQRTERALEPLATGTEYIDV